MTRTGAVLLTALALGAAAPAAAQNFPTDDPVIHAIWDEGMERSQAYDLAQVLMDSIGPRLHGSPGHRSANDWLVELYRSWGVSARNEQYGTWRGWRRGITHIDLLEPWVRSLDGMMLAWSPGTARPVEGPVTMLPDIATPEEFQAWLPNARGAFVLVSMVQPSCRPMESWEEWATEEMLERHQEHVLALDSAWDARVEATGLETRELHRALERAGALGIITSSWPGGWGAQRVFSARTEEVPSLAVECEDYGLLFRLAEEGQGPVLRVDARAEDLGEVPVFNTIAEIRGNERPEEYIVLSAHLDSWDGGTGATDNGTGTIIMAEAVRLLKTAYPAPKRTIIVGHWGGEEQGLIGSRAFAEDHPEVVAGLQVLLNQDNGTGRITRLPMQGLTEAGMQFGEWLSGIPAELTGPVELQLPGMPGGGGSDYAAFLCHGAPSFFMLSDSWDYFPYTWHTNLDTFDKIAFDAVRANATLTAMLVYLASEDPDFTSRTRRTAFPINPRTGEPMTWPECRPAQRSSDEYFRR